MKLKSFGCSFVFGTDLPNDGRYGPIATPSDHAYPVLIAKHLGLDWSCHARPGAGNFEILHNIMTEISREEPMLCVINWSWIDRYSFIDENMVRPTHLYNPMGWASIMPIDQTDVAKMYYKNLHTQVRDKIETLICIKTAIDCLRSSGHQFIMTWTDESIWETQWHCPPSVAWLQREIQDYLADFEGTSFLDWSRKNSFPISATMHPLEQAHQAAADKIVDNWNYFVRS